LVKSPQEKNALWNDTQATRQTPVQQAARQSAPPPTRIDISADNLILEWGHSKGGTCVFSSQKVREIVEASMQTPAPQGARHEGGEREDEQETAEFWHRCYSEACDKINEQDVEIKRLRAATTHPGYAASPVSTGADAKDAARYVQETERLRAALAEVVWAFDKRWHAESERKRTAAISPRMEEAFNDARLLLAGNSPEAALAAMSDEAGKV
jgi:hypothetical protein